MRTRVVGMLALAILVIAVIWVAAPRTAVTLNEAGTEVVGIDVLGLTRQAKGLPEQHYAAH